MSFRFKVVIEILRPEKPDATLSLRGVNYIDVGPLATKDYKLSLYSCKEGLVQTKVRAHGRQLSSHLVSCLASVCPLFQPDVVAYVVTSAVQAN